MHAGQKLQSSIVNNAHDTTAATIALSRILFLIMHAIDFMETFPQNTPCIQQGTGFSLNTAVAHHLYQYQSVKGCQYQQYCCKYTAHSH